MKKQKLVIKSICEKEDDDTLIFKNTRIKSKGDYVPFLLLKALFMIYENNGLDYKMIIHDIREFNKTAKEKKENDK